MYGLQAKGHKWLYNNKIRYRFLHVIPEFNQALPLGEARDGGRVVDWGSMDWEGVARGGLMRGMRGIYSLPIYFAYLHHLAIPGSCTK